MGGVGDVRPIDDRAVRRHRKTLIAFVLGVMGVSVLSGVLISVLGARHRSGRHHFSAAGLTIALGIVVTVVVLVGIWAAWLYRRPAYEQVLQHGWRMRRRVAKKVSKNQPLTSAERKVATDQVALLRRQGWVTWFSPALALIWTANAVTHHGAVRWVELVGAMVSVATFPFALRQRRRMTTNYERLSWPNEQPNA